MERVWLFFFSDFRFSDDFKVFSPINQLKIFVDRSTVFLVYGYGEPPINIKIVIISR